MIYTHFFYEIQDRLKVLFLVWFFFFAIHWVYLDTFIYVLWSISCAPYNFVINFLDQEVSLDWPLNLGYINVTEAFWSCLELSFFGSVFLTIPYFFYSIASFIKPMLFNSELFYSSVLLKLTSYCWIFCFFIGLFYVYPFYMSSLLLFSRDVFLNLDILVSSPHSSNLLRLSDIVHCYLYCLGLFTFIGSVLAFLIWNYALYFLVVLSLHRKVFYVTYFCAACLSIPISLSTLPFLVFGLGLVFLLHEFFIVCFFKSII